MATSYSSRFYNTSAPDPAISPKDGYPLSGKGGLLGCRFSETIATTVTDADGDRHFCFPLPGFSGKAGENGSYLFAGFWIKSAALAASALDLDLVLVYTVNGVELTHATPLYDASVEGVFTSAIAMKWVDVNRRIPVSDTGYAHAVLLTRTAGVTPAAGNVTILPEWI
jgi:hypothetical protein